MQAWNQWGAPAAAAAAAAAAGYQGYTAPPPPAAAAAAPQAVTPGAGYSLGYHQYYSTAPPLPGATSNDFTGWTALQQQQWQQWQQWQQQFQQWQQQYGDKYQESVNAMMAAAGTTAPAAAPAVPPPVGPDLNQPPPLPPPDPKTTVPPPPPDDRTSDPYATHSQYNTMVAKSHDLTDHQAAAYAAFMPGGPFSVPPPSVPPPPSHPPPSTQLPPPAPPPSQQIPPPPTSIPPPPAGVPPPPPSKPNEDFSNKGYSTTTGGSGTGKRSYDQDYQSGNESYGETPKKARNENFSSGDRSQNSSFSSVGWEEKPSLSSQRSGGGSGKSGREKGDSSSRASKEQPIQDNPDELLKAEKTFDIQFKHWEEQFAKWKEQNINHPDKVQYREYEAKWEAWKENLLQRRTQMRKKREAACKQQQLNQQSSPQGPDSQTPGADGADSSKTGTQVSADTTPTRGGSASGRHGTPGSTSGYFSGGDVSRASEEQDMSKADKSLEVSSTNNSGFNFAAVGGGFAQAGEEDITSQNFDSSSQAGFKDSPSVPFLGKSGNSTDKVKDSSLEEPKEFISSTMGSGGIPGLDLISEGKNDTENKEENKACEEERQLSIGHDKDERDASNRSSFIGPLNMPQGMDLSSQSSQDAEKPLPSSQESTASKTSFSPSQSGTSTSNVGLLGPAPQQSPAGVQGFGTGPGFGQQGAPGGPTGMRGPVPPQGPPNQGGPGLLSYPGSGPQGGFQNQSNYSGPPPLFGQTQGPPPGYGGSGSQPFGGYNAPPPNNQNFRQGNFGPNNQNFGPGNQQGGFGPGNRGGNFNNQGPNANQQGGFGGNQQFGGQAPLFNAEKGLNAQQGNFGSNNAPSLLGPGGLGGNQNFSNRGPGGGPGFGGNQLNPQAFSGNRPNTGGFSTGLNPQAFGMPPGPPTGNQNFGNKPPPLFGNKTGGAGGVSGGFGSDTQGPAGPNSQGLDGPGGPEKQSAPGGSGGPSGAGASAPGSGLGGPGGQTAPPFGESPGNWKEGDKGGWNRDGPPRDNFSGGRDNRDNFSRDFRDREGFSGPRDSFDGPPRDGGFFGASGGMKDRFPPPNEQGGPGRNFDRQGPREDRDYRGEFDGRGGRGGRGRGGFGGWQEDRGRGRGGGPGGGRGRFRDEPGMEAPPSLLGDGPGTDAGRPWDRNEKDDPYNRDRWMDEGTPHSFTEPPPPKGWMGPKAGENRPWGGGGTEGGGRGEDRFGGPPRPWERGPEWEELEPATVVDYGHRPASGDAKPPGNAFPDQPVQTFDYGHGSSARRPEGGPQGGPGPGAPPPRPPQEPWRRDEPPPNFRGNRDRDDRFHRGERDWGRGGGGGGSGGVGSSGGWESEREFGKREPNRWERDRDRERDRRDVDSGRDRERDRERGDRDRERDRERDEKGRWGDDNDNFPPPPDAPPPPTFTPLSSEQQTRAVLIEDLLSPPGRNTRPGRLVMILRGPPGSGKTFVAKLIKDKEVEMGGSAPRILCLDDYFMVEMEKEDKDPETGRKITTKVMEYEYEAGMDKHYRSSLIKTFRKTILDGYFPFIIVDCINDKAKHFEEMWSFAKQKGFQVYICEMDMDASTCTKRNIHNRSEKDILDIIKNWEETPKHFLRVDVRSLLQSVAITEVEMEDTTLEDCPEEEVKPEDGIAIGEVDPGEMQDGDEVSSGATQIAC